VGAEREMTSYSRAYHDHLVTEATDKCVEEKRVISHVMKHVQKSTIGIRKLDSTYLGLRL
jgi:lysyl-tRNA synthetase class I